MRKADGRRRVDCGDKENNGNIRILGARFGRSLQERIPAIISFSLHVAGSKIRSI